jgi:hypothetical protein
MADLSRIEKIRLERLFGMASGFVLSFSNRTFAETVLESTGEYIYNEKYNRGSGSEAQRLRAFWDSEPNHVVGKLLLDLLEYQRELNSAATRRMRVRGLRRESSFLWSRRACKRPGGRT